MKSHLPTCEGDRCDCGDDDPICSDMLNDVRWEIPCVIEEIGTIAGLLREAISDTNDDNVCGAAMVANDALEEFAKLESRLSNMAAIVAKWVDFAEKEGV